MERSPIETSIAPWLAVPDGAAAVEFYGNAFGAEETYRLDGEEGRIAVARLGIGAAELWVQEDRDSDTSANGSIRMILTVDDPDAWFERAVSAGATQVFPVSEEHGWRTGRITDPFGHDWELSRPVEDG